jgi:8-oxo-dGTP diphosphatase
LAQDNGYKGNNVEGYKSPSPPLAIHSLHFVHVIIKYLVIYRFFKLSKDNDKRNPIPTIDIIIQGKPNSDDNNKTSTVLLVKRKKDPFKDYFALPGGFVDEGEKVEDAVRREAKEELSVKVEPIDILGVYSDPDRDPRGHIMSITFIAKIVEGELKAGDDASEIKMVKVDDMDKVKLAFDHSQILTHYVGWLKSKETFWSSK